jgi:integrase/recombinase XerD
MTAPTLGQVVYSFFIDHLQIAKGLRPSSVSSYRDGVRLFLRFVAADVGCKITKLSLAALTPERVLRFLQGLEEDRHNHVRTRNQRLAILRTLFEYLGGRVPELLSVAERVARIPTKKVPPPETYFLDRDDVRVLFDGMPSGTWAAERDRALLLFLYNTGARVQEAVDLRVGHLELERAARVRLHGKGDKWRTCPLWSETAERLRQLVRHFESGSRGPGRIDDPVFRSRQGGGLTRFGIYKIVRRHCGHLDADALQRGRRVTPHVLRHTTAVHLLEAGVEVNVIRGWLGHVSLDTTNRYAEINIRTKEAALGKCAPPVLAGGFARKPPWRTDASLMDWLDSL